MKTRIRWTEIIIIVISVLSGFFTWHLNEKSKLEYENYIRREARFSALISCLHGFGVETNSKELRSKFIKELELCWLYCSDDVIIKAYNFLESVSDQSDAVEKEQQIRLGELMLAIRKDLIKNKNIEETNLKPSDFHFLIAR